VATGCPACGPRRLRVRAVQTATYDTLDGDPVSAPRWEYASLAARVFRVDCLDCHAVVWSSDACPGCAAAGRLEKALVERHGLPVPKACPQCGLPTLVAKAEVRMHHEVLHAHWSRRVADAAPDDDGGFHVIEVRCKDCDEVVAAVGDARCALCGRSSLLRRR